MAWTGVMAQNTNDADYIAAKNAITDGATYRIKTTVSGTDYYVTTAGSFTTDKNQAGYFTITKTSGGYFGTGFRIDSGTERFTNPPLSNNYANLKPGNFNHSTGDRADWERQILYLNGDGKYAIRSCNCVDGTSSWNDAARTHWTYYMNGSVVTPCYTYNKDEAYIWDFEGPLTAVNVTYNLYESDGTTLVSTATTKQEANSAPLSPLPGTGSIFNGFFHEKFYFDYTVSGTIGTSDCTINIVRTEKPGLVKALSDLSNNKAYNIGCDRGAMIAYNGSMCSTALNDATANAQPYGKFALLNYEGNYYIFSIDEGKFIKNNAALSFDLIADGFGSSDAMVMTAQTAPYFLWHFNAEGKYLNTNGNLPLGYVINNYSTPDPGNLYYMVAVEDFDPTNALAELDAYFHPAYKITYVVKDPNGNTLATFPDVPAAAGAHITTLPADFQRPYYTYDEVDVTITNIETTIEVKATWDGPFEISADYATAHWYDMSIRSTWYVTSGKKDSDGALQTVNANALGLGEPAYHWAFVGDGYNGFKVYNKAEGADKVYAWTSNANSSIPTFVDAATANVWTIKPSTATGYTDAFMLTIPVDGYQVNQFGGAGGSLKIWQATGTADDGSAFKVFDIPSNYAEFFTNEIAPDFDSDAKYFVLTNAAKASIGYDDSYKTSCSFEQYKALKEKLTDTFKAEFFGNITNYVLPPTGYYILKNKHYEKYMGIDPSDANMYGNYASATAAKQIVKLTRTGDATYTIGLMGKFAPATVERSKQVTASTNAGTYTVSVPALGCAAFQADTEEQYSVMHCASDGSIVGWVANAAASMWEVEDATSIEFTIGNEGYATAYLPFSVTVPTEVTAYTGETEETWLKLNEITGVIPARTAVVLKGNANTYALTIVADDGTPIDGALKGTLEPIAATGKYILAKPDGEDVGFYKANGGNIAATKAYLESDSDVKAFYFADDDATGIANVEKVIENGLIYNVAGQRLNKIQKGINIVNGKKILK